MTTPRVIPAQPGPIAYDQLRDLSAAPTVKPVSVLAGTRDYGQVLHQIRALLLFACFTLATLVILVAAIGHQLSTPRPGTVADISTPSSVVLSLPGPDSALDYFAHVALADGSERDVELGAFLADRPVRITLHANAPDVGQVTCRIAVNGILVTTESSENGGTATCDWRADA